MQRWAAAAVIVVSRGSGVAARRAGAVESGADADSSAGACLRCPPVPSGLHTRAGIRKHGAAHKGGIKPLCASGVS